MRAFNIHENRSFLIEISKMERTQASCPTNSTVTVKMKPSRIAIFLCVTSSLLMSTACAPVLIGSAAVTGVSVAADRRSAGAVANDGVIEAKSAMHLSQTNFASSHITTTSYEGNVLLSGEIDSEASKQKATEIVKSINEVNKVYNELAVQPNSSLTTRMNDSITASKVRAALLDNKQVTLTSIKVVGEFVISLERLLKQRLKSFPRLHQGFRALSKLFVFSRSSLPRSLKKES